MVSQIALVQLLNIQMGTLMFDLKQIVANHPKLTASISSLLASKHGCSERTIRRHFSKLKKDIQVLQPEKPIAKSVVNNEPSQRRNLSNEEWNFFVNECMVKQKHAGMSHVLHNKLCVKYNISESTVKRFWCRICSSLKNKESPIDISCQRKGKCGKSQLKE